MISRCPNKGAFGDSRVNGGAEAKNRSSLFAPNQPEYGEQLGLSRKGRAGNQMPVGARPAPSCRDHITAMCGTRGEGCDGNHRALEMESSKDDGLEGKIASSVRSHPGARKLDAGWALLGWAEV